MPSPLSSSAVYQAYLIRLWRPAAEMPWRATARHVSSGEEWHFEDLERLFLFLHRQTGESSITNLREEASEKEDRWEVSHPALFSG